MKEAVPAMNDKINDLLTAHYAQQGKRFAGEDAAVREVLQAIEAGRDAQSTGSLVVKNRWWSMLVKVPGYMYTPTVMVMDMLRCRKHSANQTAKSIRVYLQQHYCVV